MWSQSLKTGAPEGSPLTVASRAALSVLWNAPQSGPSDTDEENEGPGVIRNTIERALNRATGIIREGHGLVPAFDIYTPSESFMVLCPMPDAVEARLARLQLMSRFMASRMATKFVFSTELADPDAVSSIFVSRSTVAAGVRLINRKPLSFGETQWISGIEKIGDEIPSLLPRKVEELNTEDRLTTENAILEFSPDALKPRARFPRGAQR